MKKKNQSEKKQGRSKTKSKDDHGPERELKDHVLQARVSQSLYKDLVTQARRLRVPVSNLVRNILEDSTRMVENLVDGGLEIAEALSSKVDEEDISSVLGWQPMITNKDLICAQCRSTVPKGGQAFMSVGAPGGRTIVICEECKCKI